jgi:hypothetical protein
MITASLNFIRDKNREYHTDFRLYPKSQLEPIFEDLPINVFKQTKWVQEYESPINYKLKKIYPIGNRIGMLEGTAWELTMPAIDPSNLLNPADDDGITYVWKRDGSVLYEFSSQNNLKGTKTIAITSESCTRDISGVYEIEATNRYGTTTSEQIVVDVINLDYHPYLFKNLLVNGSGEKGLDEWTTDQDIITRPYSNDNRNQWSIPNEVYAINYSSPYTTEFGFSYYSNETALARWFDWARDFSASFDPNVTTLAWYNRWIIKTFPPCLVPTDGGTKGFQDSFFPSWDYIDTYNDNLGLYRLDNIVSTSKKYITRDKIKFAIYGGKAKSLAYQDIDVSEISGIVDGETYGIDRLVAHFFAYIGIGISTYDIEYVDATTDKLVRENIIPVNQYRYKVGTLRGRPSLIPMYDNPNNWENVVSTYNETIRNKYAAKIKENTPINLIPVCYDKTDIRLDFISVGGEVISSETIQGPTEKDIWAVKEKFFLPFHIANLYGWCTDASTQEFRVYSQSYTSISAVRNVDGASGAPKDVHAEYVKKYYYPLLDFWNVPRRNGSETSLTSDTNDEGNVARIEEAINHYGLSKSFVQQFGNVTIPLWWIEGITDMRFDKGAAAFFGIQRDVVVPKGTRIIRANIIFNHNSEILYETNPRSKGWSEQEIYYDQFTRAEASPQLVAYSYPRCGVTAMHISLHPNNVEKSDKYNTYMLNLTGSVWKQQLDRQTIPNEYDTRRPATYDINDLQYKYVVSNIPNYTTTVQQEGPITVEELVTILGQNYPQSANETTPPPSGSIPPTPVEGEVGEGEPTETTGSIASGGG